MERAQPIIIIGGGAAGLATAGALKRQGLESRILDKDPCIGGTWQRRYERLHLHTVRWLSGLPGYAIPRHYPRYLPRQLFASYLQDYADRLGLTISLRCEVQAVRPAPPGADPGWLVKSSCGVWRSQVLIIACGQYSQPVIPSWPGQQRYQGQLIHAASYHSGRSYAGKRVLVVGAGNSGTEIATDLVEQGAAFVALSLRRAPLIVPRDLLGLPVQLSGLLLSYVPAAWADRISARLAGLALGDLRRYGLQAPGWRPFSDQRIPTIDVGFVRLLKQRRLQLRPPVVSFTPSGVDFGPGQEEQYDAVIAATGYTSGLQQLIALPGLLDAAGYPRYPNGQPTPYQGLYFIGYTYSLRGHLFEISRAARHLARRVKDELRVSGCAVQAQDQQGR